MLFSRLSSLVSPRSLALALTLTLTLSLGACSSARPPRPPPPAPGGGGGASAAFRNAHWGILVVDPATGDTLYSHNAGKLFMPASNMKLLTGATAMAQLGPDFRWRTTYSSRGAVRDSVLHGDLIVTGRGDPSISDHMRGGDGMAPLRELADSLRAHGIARVTGRLIHGGDAFPDSTHGFGWSWSDFDFPYSAGVDELFFNEGFTLLTVRGAHEAGRPVTVQAQPASGYPRLRVTAQTVVRPPPVPGDTVRARRSRRANLNLYADGDTTVVVVGTMFPDDSAPVAIAHRDPALAYLTALREALGERGVRVERGVTARSEGDTLGPMAADGDAMDAGAARAPDSLFTFLSMPLRDVFAAMSKPSQNQVAEILFKTLGLERTGVGTADSGRRVVERQLAAWGAAPDGFAVRDGSGLSRHDYISPETVIRVLDAMRRDTAFTVFYAGLPIAGVDGTISGRMKGTAAEGNVHAKTGSVDKARSLSGYVTTADGRLLLFSFLCNNWTVPVRQVEDVQDAIADRLARLRLTSR
jgi:D-alanyl-D-alanine carboxypeptidase/D-alanyl-D-alanine-endopeptidase (penicillin-binding protein 4)